MHVFRPIVDFPCVVWGISNWEWEGQKELQRDLYPWLTAWKDQALAILGVKSHQR